MLHRFVGAASVAALIVFAVTPATAQPAAGPPERRQAYTGAARICNLERIMIVYPARDGIEGRIARESALLRASWLLERYGVETAVVADDAITDADREGHLLVLGWDNALTREEWFRQAVKLDGEKRSFVGATASATDDLLFMHRSPEGRGRFIVFWSRIDPELDRSLPFVFLGSDWGWYRDYFILQQGNFHEAKVWPPKRDLEAERDRSPKPMPLVETSAHYALHQRPGSIDEATRATILEVRERSLARAAELLGFAIPEDFVIDLYVYQDNDAKHELGGVADPVHALPNRRELFMTAGHARREYSQEEIHILAANRWGLCHAAGMYQGLAIYLQADPRDQGAYAALLVEQDRVPRLADIFADEKLRKLTAAGYGFPAAALMVEWIVARGGMAAVGEAYGLLRTEALDGLARMFELGDADGVEAAFAAWVNERAANSKDDLAYRRAFDTARERGRVGDQVGQIAALREALEVRPEELALAYRLAIVEMEAGETDDARKRLEGLVARTPPLDPAWVAPFSRVKLAGLLARSGDTAGARRLYREVLAGPNERDAHRYATEALAELGEE